MGSNPFSGRSGGGGSISSTAALSQAPILARAAQAVTLESASSAAQLFYFEVFIKTTGGGLQPNGSVSIGLVEASSDADAAAQRRASAAPDEWPEQPSLEEIPFFHYHSSGRKFARFPRAGSKAGRAAGPAFGIGDTVGCGWLPQGGGEVFFTCNGKHLGVAFQDVRGRFCPAVDLDSPGAHLELTYGLPGERKLRYTGDGSGRASERWLRSVMPSRLLDAAQEKSERTLEALKTSSGSLLARTQQQQQRWAAKVVGMQEEADAAAAATLSAAAEAAAAAAAKPPLPSQLAPTAAARPPPPQRPSAPATAPQPQKPPSSSAQQLEAHARPAAAAMGEVSSSPSTGGGLHESHASLCSNGGGFQPSGGHGDERERLHGGWVDRGLVQPSPPPASFLGGAQVERSLGGGDPHGSSSSSHEVGGGGSGRGGGGVGGGGGGGGPHTPPMLGGQRS